MAKRMPDVGDRLGRYLLTDVLGRGGMGTVFEARDDDLERTVAVKVINAAVAGDDEYRERFRREAVAMSRMSSPHVVPVHDHGEQDGHPYLVTQLVSGGDLDRLIRHHGALPPARALDLADQVLHGLTDAHAAGIVHRDVKPSNVLLSGDGERAYLCDFGIATSPGSAITRTGALVGSFPYMAPERHTGDTAHQVGPVSDVYAVGCLLWEMLSGTPPYIGTDVEIALGHLHGPAPQLPGRDPFSAAMNRVLRRSLAKDPTQRYPSTRAMRADLALAAAQAPARVDLPAETAVRQRVPSAGPERRRLPAAVTPLLAVAAVVLGVVAVVLAVQGAPAVVVDTLTGDPSDGSTSPGTSVRSGAVLAPSPGTEGARAREGVTDRQADGGGRGSGADGRRAEPGGDRSRDLTDDPTDPGPRRRAAYSYSCWDGSTRDALSECGYPSGTTGVSWMFSGFDSLPCRPADVPGTGADIEAWNCAYSGPDAGTNSITFARWTSPQAALDHYRAIGPRVTWTCGEDVCGTSLRGAPAGKHSYARVYRWRSFWSVNIRADTAANRSRGFDLVGNPRDPSNITGVRR